MQPWRRVAGTATVVVARELRAEDVVASVLGVDAASVALAHLCPGCGSTSHGRPHIAEPGAGRDAGLSLAHSHGLDAVAVNPGGLVGVDLESIAQVARRPIAASLLHPDEGLGAPEDVAGLWTAKEAVLKLLGVGLRLDPRELHVEGDRLISWPQGLLPDGPPRIRTFSVTDDLVCTVAHL